MDNRRMSKMVLGAAVFTALTVTIMLHRAATKHIMITDAAGIESGSGRAGESFSLTLDKNVPKGKEGVLTIPLSKDVSSDDILLEDRYIDHELRIYINSREENFYTDHAVVTDLTGIERAECIREDEGGKVCLDFKLDGLYSNESLLTDQGTIEVTFFDPRDKYSRIVVVDPVGGDAEEIPLSVAKELKALSEKDVGVRTKLYFTRLDNEEVTEDKRAKFISETDADLFIRLDMGKADDPEKSGVLTEFNDNFYLRSLSNAEFADILEKNCVSLMGCNAAGCMPSEDQVLGKARIPAAKVDLGFATSERDVALLSQNANARKAAEGIYRGILEAFKETE